MVVGIVVARSGVGEANEEGRDQQSEKAARRDRQDKSEQMTDESEDHDELRPKRIIQIAEQDHCQREAKKGHAIDPTELRIGQSEII